jgi:Sensors of blue-light using FAD
MSEFVNIVYASRAGQEFGAREARHRLRFHSQSENAKREITGLLVYCEGIFIQSLEGPIAAVDSLYDAISRDTRHSEVDLLARAIITKRAFGKWTMGIIEAADYQQTNSPLEKRFAAIAALRPQLDHVANPGAALIEAFLDPENHGIAHTIR